MEFTDYEMLARKLKALTENCPYEIANLANASALFWQELPGINWVGFYRMEGGKLVLGPFQGKPACIQISLGSGVCGKAAAEDQTQVVEDVHAFPGHIACDSASNSELVIPIHKEGRVWGVLDIDSPHLGRFTREAAAGLQKSAAVLEEILR